MAKTLNIIAADIGGTNSRFGWFEAWPEGLVCKKTVWFKSLEFQSFGQLASRVRHSGLGLAPEDADLAVIAVPGAVRQGRRAFPANLPWNIDIADWPGARARLINDFLAQAFACPTKVVADAKQIKPGQPEEGGTIAVIGAGTGLGHCALVFDSDGRILAMPSEAGHMAFALYGERELAFQRFVLAETGKPYPYGDLVVTGSGLTLLHKFLTGEELAPPEISTRASATDETVEWFARFYGRACRNWALATVATGGVHIAGGVAAKNPSFVTHPAFVEEFLLSATQRPLLDSIPIRLGDNEESGLWGAAYFGLTHIEGKAPGGAS